VRFVPVDFARDSLGEALAAAGHHAGASTFWLWEGVTPYLPREALRATLAAIAGRSAAGSRVAVTYGTPEGWSLGPALMRVAHVAFRALGESLVGLLPPEEMQAELAGVGFSLLEDLPATAWGARYGGESRRRLLLLYERLAIAAIDAPLRASHAA
jgi:methyltransferase (TIGR00027 family)